MCASAVCVSSYAPCLCVSAVRCVFNASGIVLHYPKDRDMRLERKATAETRGCPPPPATSGPLADG